MVTIRIKFCNALLAILILFGCAATEDFLEVSAQLLDWKEQGRKIAGVFYRNAGQLFMAEDQYDLAMTIISDLMRYSHVFSSDYQNLIVCMIRSKHTDLVLKTTYDWVENFPEDGRAHMTVGIMEVIHGQVDLGVRELNKANALVGGSEENIIYLINEIRILLLQDLPELQMIEMGRSLAAIGEWDLALAAFGRATDLAPDYAESWAFSAEAWLQIGMEPEAKSAIEKALTINPDSVSANLVSAHFWRKRQEYNIAIKYHSKAMALEPGRAILSAELGSLYALQGNLQNALKYYQLAVDQEPETTEFLILLARFCADYDFQLREIGLPAARKALSLGVENSVSQEVMGEVLFKLGDFSVAERFLQQAIHDETCVLARLRLAQIYIQNNQFEMALPFLQDVVRIGNPESVEAQVAQRILDQYYPPGD